MPHCIFLCLNCVLHFVLLFLGSDTISENCYCIQALYTGRVKSPFAAQQEGCRTVLKLGKSHKPNTSCNLRDIIQAVPTSTNRALQTSYAVHSFTVTSTLRYILLPNGKEEFHQNVRVFQHHNTVTLSTYQQWFKSCYSFDLLSVAHVSSLSVLLTTSTYSLQPTDCCLPTAAECRLFSDCFLIGSEL